MDKASSVIAALNAGKQPSQKQLDAWFDWLLQSELLQVDQTTRGGELTENGRKLARDARGILEAYKNYGSHVNSDDKLQEALWHLSKADVSSASVDVDVGVDQDEAARDYRAITSSLRTSLQVLWSSFASEGSGVFGDFASFMRLSLADMAEVIGEQATQSADSLRSIDREVQEGERDAIGRKRSSPDSPEETDDVRIKFERGMDSAKVAGSTIIGAGQSAKAKAEDLADRSTSRIRLMTSRIAQHAQQDPEYRHSLDAVFNLIQKWIRLSGGTVDQASESTSLESFINDPTDDQHLIKALRCLRQLAESAAGGKSLDDFFNALRQCILDIRHDQDLQSWASDFLNYLKRNLETVGQVDEETMTEQKKDLKQRWKGLTSSDSDKGRQWKEDISLLRKELHAYEARTERDPQLQNVKAAHAKFNDDLQQCLASTAATGAQLALDQASWIWQDFFNVYLPRLMGLIKSVPIPRTEYKDPETEFVLEDLDISSLSLLPGNVFIRNITDIEISAPEDKEASSAVGSLTHVHLKAVQLSLREVSFYFRDKTAAMGPAEFTGVAEVTLPPQGLDIDLKVRMISSTPEGLKQREQRNGFLVVENVQVKLNDDADVSVKQSNHPVLLTMFKPLVNSSLRGAFETVLREQIRGGIETLDSILWDVGRRAEVFEDAGLTRGPALTAAFWSELGRMRRAEGGLFSGWHATGTGLVKDIPSENAQFAMGAEPQVISGEKRGPKGNLSQPLAERMPIDTEDVTSQASGVIGKAKETVQQGVQKVKSFKVLVEQKTEEEERRPGWKSAAFDI